MRGVDRTKLSVSALSLFVGASLPALTQTERAALALDPPSAQSGTVLDEGREDAKTKEPASHTEHPQRFKLPRAVNTNLHFASWDGKSFRENKEPSFEQVSHPALIAMPPRYSAEGETWLFCDCIFDPNRPEVESMALSKSASGIKEFKRIEKATVLDQRRQRIEGSHPAPFLVGQDLYMAFTRSSNEGEIQRSEVWIARHIPGRSSKSEVFLLVGETPLFKSRDDLKPVVFRLPGSDKIHVLATAIADLGSETRPPKRRVQYAIGQIESGELHFESESVPPSLKLGLIGQVVSTKDGRLVAVGTTETGLEIFPVEVKKKSDDSDMPQRDRANTAEDPLVQRHHALIPGGLNPAAFADGDGNLTILYGRARETHNKEKSDEAPPAVLADLYAELYAGPDGDSQREELNSQVNAVLRGEPKFWRPEEDLKLAELLDAFRNSIELYKKASSCTADGEWISITRPDELFINCDLAKLTLAEARMLRDDGTVPTREMIDAISTVTINMMDLAQNESDRIPDFARLVQVCDVLNNLQLVLPSASLDELAEIEGIMEELETLAPIGQPDAAGLTKEMAQERFLELIDNAKEGETTEVPLEVFRALQSEPSGNPLDPGLNLVRNSTRKRYEETRTLTALESFHRRNGRWPKMGEAVPGVISDYEIVNDRPVLVRDEVND